MTIYLSVAANAPDDQKAARLELEALVVARGLNLDNLRCVPWNPNRCPFRVDTQAPLFVLVVDASPIGWRRADVQFVNVSGQPPPRGHVASESLGAALDLMLDAEAAFSARVREGLARVSF